MSTAAWIFIGIPLVVVWVIGVADILRHDLPRGAKAAWLIIVVVLPVLGTLLYWVLRRPSDQEIRRAQEASRALEGDWPGVKHRLPDE